MHNVFHVIHDVGGEENGVFVRTKLGKSVFTSLLAYVEFLFEEEEVRNKQLALFFETPDIIEAMAVYGCLPIECTPNGSIKIERWENRERHCGTSYQLATTFANPRVEQIVGEIYLRKYAPKK